MPIFDAPRLLPLGDGALTLQFGDEVSAEANALVLGFERALGEARQRGDFAGVVECVPAFASITLHVHDATEAAASARDAALLALARRVQPLRVAGRHWRLPACFDAEFAPDLPGLAEAHASTPEQIVARILAARLRVYMLGFMPGFAFLGDLPDGCSLPRRASPRAAVPERSVAVAGRMCAVYPWESPGGWHLIGRTPVRLFDARAAQPALLRPGDVLEWVSIDRAAFDALERRVRDGEVERSAWLVADAP